MRKGIFAYISPVDRQHPVGWVKEHLEMEHSICEVAVGKRNERYSVAAVYQQDKGNWWWVPTENVHIVPDELLDVAKKEAAASGLSEEEGMKILEQYIREVVEGKDDE